VNVLTRLLRMLIPFRWWVVLAVLLSFATIGSSVGLMAMSAYLIAKAALVTSIADLSVLIVAVRFFAIARAALRYAERYITHRATFQILTELRVWFFRAIEPLAPAGLQQYRSGDLLARIGADIETLENFYIRVVAPPLAAVLVTALACFILGMFDVWLGVVLAFFLVLTGIILPLATRWLSSLPAAALIATRAQLAATLVDDIQGLADLLVCGQSAVYEARTTALDGELSRHQERLAQVRGLANALGVLFAGLAGLVVLFLAIPLVTRGQIDGVMLALLPLTAIASFEAVQPLGQALQYLEASRAAAGRLFALIDAPPSAGDPIAPSPTPLDNGVEVHDLCFRYSPDDPWALNGISFSAAPGSCNVIVGPSGAGKSSLVNVLTRFWEYEAGTITIGGHDLRAYHADDVRALLGVVSQQTYLFNGTIRDNLLLANGDASDTQIEDACREAQLHDFVAGLPDGYDTLVGENGLKLSGGERQRLAIARVILKAAPILILDEATAHLDAVTEQQLLAGLAPFMAGRTTLIITHRARAVGRVDQVIALDEGRLVAPVAG
jgi:thiol reductant ABC exporter CydC subunit